MMIENVQSKEDEQETTTSRYQGFRAPKNIKQIGESTSQKKIYVEDYAFTYIKELVKKEYTDCKIAVLLGHYIKLSEERILLINGAVEAVGVNFDSEQVFNNETWTNIYESIKRYFSDVEVVGWFIGGPGFLLENTDKIKKIHLDNFAGVDKALLVYDSVEEEEGFYFFEHGALTEQRGYYIYYEKNDDMQNYIVDHKPTYRTGKDEKEMEVQEYKAEIKEKKSDENHKSVLHLVYALASLMVVVILAAFAAVLRNSNEIRELKKTVEELSITVAASGSGRESQETTTVMAPEQKKSTMQVDTVNGSLQSIKTEEVIGDKSNEVIEGNKEEAKQQPSDDLTQKEDESSEDELDKESGRKVERTVESEKEEAGQTEETEETSDPEEAKETSGEKAKYYEVKKGDSLVGISFELYGSGDYVSKIMELNGIEDMDKIYYGQKLLVP